MSVAIAILETSQYKCEIVIMSTRCQYKCEISILDH